MALVSPKIPIGTRAKCVGCGEEIAYTKDDWQHDPKLGFGEYEPHFAVPVLPIPPKGGSGTCPPVKQCSHRFVFLRSAKWTEDSGYNTHYFRLDTFFCGDCLDQKEIRKDEYARETPDWYRG